MHLPDQCSLLIGIGRARKSSQIFFYSQINNEKKKQNTKKKIPFSFFQEFTEREKNRNTKKKYLNDRKTKC